MADTDKKKGLMYVDGHEIPNVVANINRLCGWWFNKYFPLMLYFEGVDMNRVEPELEAGETDFVAVFRDESLFRVNEDQRFF